MAKLRTPIEKQEEILRLYDEGKAAREICALAGVSDGTARRVIARHRGSVERRYCSGRKHGWFYGHDYSDVVRYYNEGMPTAWIAEMCGVSRAHVSRIALDNGCTPRNKQARDPELEAAIRRGLQTGQTWRQLARDHYVCFETVNRIRKRIKAEGGGNE